MKRREWLKMNILLLWATALGFITNTAASCSDVLSQLKTWIPLGLTAFGGVLTVINPPAGAALTVAFNIASGLWTALSSAVSTYENNTNAGQAPTLLSKVIAGLQALGTQLTSILSDVHLTNTQDQNYATESLQLLIGTLSNIAAGLEGNSSGAKAAAMSAQAKSAAKSTALTSVKNFKSAYNAIAYKYGHAEVGLK